MCTFKRRRIYAVILLMVVSCSKFANVQGHLHSVSITSTLLVVCWLNSQVQEAWPAWPGRWGGRGQWAPSRWRRWWCKPRSPADRSAVSDQERSDARVPDSGSQLARPPVRQRYQRYPCWRDGTHERTLASLTMCLLGTLILMERFLYGSNTNLSERDYWYICSIVLMVH